MMRHPSENDLAGLDDRELQGSLAGHLHWCATCQRVRAEYAWLEVQLTEALRAEAERAPIGAARWVDVRGRLETREERSMGRRVAGVASVALTACTVLLAPFALHGGRARLVAAGDTVSTAPPPVVAPMTRDGRAEFGLTSTSISRPPRVSLPFVPPPTPPEPRT